MSRSCHEGIRTVQWPVALAALWCGIFLSPALPASASQLTNVQTVFLIVMENVSWSAIKGSSAAPYINNTLLPQAAFCEQYCSPTGAASSLPDYFWLEGGTNFGITTSPEPANARISNTNHFVALLETARISWKGYFEGISATNCHSPVADSTLLPQSVRLLIPGQTTDSPFRGAVEQNMLKFVAEQIRFRVVFRFRNTVLADGVHTVFTFANWPLCSGCQ